MLERRFELSRRKFIYIPNRDQKRFSPPKLSIKSIITLVWLASLIFLIIFLSQKITLATYTTSTRQKEVLQFREGVGEYLQPSNSNRPKIYAKAYLLIDEPSAEIILCHNCHEVLPVASTTKMATALTALKLKDKNDTVIVPKPAPAINGSKIGLRTGEKITLESLLKGLLIQSGNDAAITIASSLEQGTEVKFVDEMNNYLKENNLFSSSFADPAGLDDENGRSSAFELAHIARLLLKNDLLAQIVRTDRTSVTDTTGNISHSLKNSNRLVLADSPYYMASAIGVKTGFTLEAGHCLVGAIIWQGRTLISVVLNTTESDITASARETKKIFTWAESNLAVEQYKTLDN